MDTTDWLKSGEYLPPWLRDFHDQKDFFKALDEVAQRSVEAGNNYIRDISFASAQVYTIDIFLWMAARHGFTLQRSRKRVRFNDLDGFVADAKARRDAQYRAAMSEHFGAPSSARPDESLGVSQEAIKHPTVRTGEP